MPFHFNRIRCSRLHRAMSVSMLVAAVVASCALILPARAHAQAAGSYPIGSNTRIPDANDIMTMNQQQAKKNSFEAANLERKRQIADDVAQLLKLATELKAEVDKTGNVDVSVEVIRKAETIERLAAEVKEKMKLTVGAS